MSVSVVTSAFCGCDHAAHLPSLPLTPLFHSKSLCFFSCLSQAAKTSCHSIGHLHIKDTVCFLWLWQSLHLAQSVHLLCIASCLPFISLLSRSERQKEVKEARQCEFQWSQISASYNCLPSQPSPNLKAGLSSITFSSFIVRDYEVSGRVMFFFICKCLGR